MEHAAPNLNSRRARGVTLIELMITLVVMGITLSIAIPNFHDMIVENDVTAQVNDFILAINVARSEASRTGATVNLEAAGTVSGYEFEGGYSVVDADGTVVRKWPALQDKSTLHSVNKVTSIQFDSLGALANSQPLEFDLCNPSAPGERIYIWPIGRATVHGPDDPDTSKRPQC